MDKNWKGRGYANHIHLTVNFTNKTYKKAINYTVPLFGHNSIEVKRKSEISEYIEYLERIHGFKEIKSA